MGLNLDTENPQRAKNTARCNKNVKRQLQNSCPFFKRSAGKWSGR